MRNTVVTRRFAAAALIPLVLGVFAVVIARRVTAAPAVSQNGWSVVEKAGTASYQVPGSKVKLRIRSGDVAVVLLDVAAWFDRDIEDIDAGADDWGWAVRTISGSSSYSNHASGTAIDLNAQRHPMGVATSKNLSARQIDAIHARLRDRYKGVVRWGGDYTSRPDAMHFEINKNAAAVTSLADAIRAGAAPKPTTPPTTTPKAAPSTRPATTASTRATTTTTAAVGDIGHGEDDGHEDGAHEQMGPVEPQADAPSPPPAEELTTEAAVPVTASPRFTG